MPRKSAKGKIKICKALNLDGTKCSKQFTCKRHRSSDHKFCSEKCRKRDFRLKAKKQIQKEQRALKKINKEIEQAKQIENRINVAYNISVSTLARITILKTPIKIPKEKDMLHKDFDGISGIDKYRHYNNQRLNLQQQEKQRKELLKTNKDELLIKANKHVKDFLILIDSEELKLIINDKIRAVIKDMKADILRNYNEADETPISNMKFNLYDYLEKINMTEFRKNFNNDL